MIKFVSCLIGRHLYLNATRSPECQTLRPRLIKDESAFTNLPATSGFFTAEHILIPRPLNHIPENCFCPLTGKLMTDPVVLADGYSYERAVITKWLTSSDQSPITKKPLANKNLIPNLALKNIIAKLARNV